MHRLPRCQTLGRPAYEPCSVAQRELGATGQRGPSMTLRPPTERPLRLDAARPRAPNPGPNALVARTGPGHVAPAAECGEAAQGDAASLIMDVREFNEAQSTMTVGLQLCVTNRWLELVRLQPPHFGPLVGPLVRPSPAATTGTGLITPRRFASIKIGVGLRIFGGDAPDSSEIRLPRASTTSRASSATRRSASLSTALLLQTAGSAMKLVARSRLDNWSFRLLVVPTGIRTTGTQRS